MGPSRTAFDSIDDDDGKEDARWLLSGEASPWIRLAGDDRLEYLTRIKRLRAGTSMRRAHMVMELVDARRRGERKFSRAGDLFFTRRAVEQATDERLAEYKSRRFAGCRRVVDFCCGIGGDLFSLNRVAACEGVDRDRTVALMAEANCRALGLYDARVTVQDVRRFPVTSVDAVHVDPDRRPGGRRVSRLEDCEPGLEFLEPLRGRVDGLGIKLAPATRLPESWTAEAEVEFLGGRGECRQQMVWFGFAATRPGRRAATIIDERAPPRTVCSGSCRASSAARVETRPPGAFLYEPHAAVIAAGLVDTLAEELELDRVSTGGAYLTGQRLIDDVAVDAFRVRDVLPFDLKRLKAYLKKADIGQLEIKKRGVDVAPEKLRRQLRHDGAHRRTLILFDAGPRVVAVIASRPPA